MSKKFRNRLLALFCLLVFLGLGGVFYVKWVVQRPFAVILFLADNLTPSVLTPARNYEGGADHRLALESFPYLALATTHANDFAVCDGAAAATSIGTGRKGNNGSLGVVSGNTKLPNLLELATRCGRLTGLVSNASLTDATPAAFYASTSDPLDYMTISRQLAENPTIDILLGGGAADFCRRSKAAGVRMVETSSKKCATEATMSPSRRWNSSKPRAGAAQKPSAFSLWEIWLLPMKLRRPPPSLRSPRWSATRSNCSNTTSADIYWSSMPPSLENRERKTRASGRCANSSRLMMLCGKPEPMRAKTR